MLTDRHQFERRNAILRILRGGVVHRQNDLAQLLRRADMYLSTLRNYVHAVGGELRIQAVFPDGATIVIDRFGEYEERPYLVEAIAESGDVFRLRARPLHHQGSPLSTKPVKASGLTKAMRALHLPEVQIASVKADLERTAGRDRKSVV